MRGAALLLLFLLAGCTPVYEPPAENPAPAGLPPAAAKKLIEGHTCAGCAGATKEGLLEGIAAMQKALDAGYIDRSAALRVLAEAYNVLAEVYARPGSSEKGEALIRRRATLEQLIAFAPNDPDAPL